LLDLGAGSLGVFMVNIPYNIYVCVRYSFTLFHLFLHSLHYSSWSISLQNAFIDLLELYRDHYKVLPNTAFIMSIIYQIYWASSLPSWILFSCFWDSISLCNPRWTQSLGPPASASQMLRLQSWATMPSCLFSTSS
jgi:hypothetical protein